MLIKFCETNCDKETDFSLSFVGFSTEVKMYGDLNDGFLENFSLLVFCGGFAYGDEGGVGVLASKKVEKFLVEIKGFINRGRFVLGICNGFQILCELGLLRGSFIKNKGGKFLCSWVALKNLSDESSIFYDLPSDFELPVACGEGIFRSNHDISSVFEYKKNSHLEGFGCIEVGRVIGIMPHPERFIFAEQHFDRDWGLKNGKYGWGYVILKGLYERIKRDKG